MARTKKRFGKNGRKKESAAKRRKGIFVLFIIGILALNIVFEAQSVNAFSLIEWFLGSNKKIEDRNAIQKWLSGVIEKKVAGVASQATSAAGQLGGVGTSGAGVAPAAPAAPGAAGGQLVRGGVGAGESPAGGFIARLAQKYTPVANFISKHPTFAKYVGIPVGGAALIEAASAAGKALTPPETPILKETGAPLGAGGGAGVGAAGTVGLVTPEGALGKPLYFDITKDNKKITAIATWSLTEVAAPPAEAAPAATAPPKAEEAAPKKGFVGQTMDKFKSLIEQKFGRGATAGGGTGEAVPAPAPAPQKPAAAPAAKPTGIRGTFTKIGSAARSSYTNLKNNMGTAANTLRNFIPGFAPAAAPSVAAPGEIRPVAPTAEAPAVPPKVSEAEKQPTPAPTGAGGGAGPGAGAAGGAGEAQPSPIECTPEWTLSSETQCSAEGKKTVTYADSKCGNADMTEEVDCGQVVTQRPVCGDYICEITEMDTCYQDCGQQLAPICGDYICDLMETSETCPEDCYEGVPPRPIAMIVGLGISIVALGIVLGLLIRRYSKLQKAGKENNRAGEKPVKSYLAHLFNLKK